MRYVLTHLHVGVRHSQIELGWAPTSLTNLHRAGRKGSKIRDHVRRTKSPKEAKLHFSFLNDGEVVLDLARPLMRWSKSKVPFLLGEEIPETVSVGGFRGLAGAPLLLKGF